MSDSLGAFQIEMSFFDYSRDANRGASSDQLILGQINFLIFKTTKLALKLEFKTLIEKMCLHIFL